VQLHGGKVVRDVRQPVRHMPMASSGSLHDAPTLDEALMA
jgi:hypothetical protein